MNKRFGEWYRIVSVEPTSEQLAKRWQGVEGLRNKADNASIPNIVRTFLSPSDAPAEFLAEFRNTFFDADNAFRMQKNDKELQVLAGACLASIMGEKPTLRDRTALLLVASAAPNVRKSVIVPEVVDLASNVLFERSAEVRSLDTPPSTPLADFAPLLEGLRTALSTNQIAQLSTPLDQALNTLSTSLSSLYQQHQQQIGAARKGLKVVAEETDMVWWLFGAMSRKKNQPFTGMAAPEAALLAALDLASLTMLLPPPRAARAYLTRCLDAHASTKCNLETLAKYSELSDGLDGSDLFPFTSLLRWARNGTPPDQTASRVAKSFNLRTTPIPVPEVSYQFYTELIAANYVRSVR